MRQLKIESRVAAPPNRTFEAFTDLAHAAEHIEAIQSLELLTDGPVGMGTRFRETRVLFGKEAVEEMEIVSWQPGQSYAVEGDSCGVKYHTEFRFRPDAEGTCVELVMESRPYTVFAKVLSPVMGLLMKGSMTKLLRQDMEAMKRVAESGSA